MMHHSTETQLARKTESDSWGFGSLNHVGSAQEHQNSTTGTERERSYLIGEKRAFDSFLGSDQDRGAKRQRFDTATSDQDAKPALGTLDTGDVKPSVSATPTTAGSRATVRKGPFVIDDSSDDEDVAAPPTRQAGYGHPKADATSPNQSNGNTAAQLAAQREASARMRTGALTKKSAISNNQRSNGSGCLATGATPSAATPNPNTWLSHQARPTTSTHRAAVEENSRDEKFKPQASQKPQPQKGTTIDLTEDDEDDTASIEVRPPQGSSYFNTAGSTLQPSNGESSNGITRPTPKTATPSNLHDVFTFGSRPARREASSDYKVESGFSNRRQETPRREQHLKAVQTSPSPLPKRPSLARPHQQPPQTHLPRVIERTKRDTQEESRPPTHPSAPSRAGILEQMKKRRADAERQLRQEESREEERNRREAEDQKRRDEARRLAAEKQAQLVRQQQNLQRQNHERQTREEEEQRRREQELGIQVKKHQEAEKARKAEQAAKRAAAKRDEEREQMKMRAAAHEERIQKQKDRNVRNAEEDDDIIIEDPGDPKALIRTGLRSIASQAFQIPARPTARQNGHVGPVDANSTSFSGLATGAPRPLSSTQGALAVARSNHTSGPVQTTGNFAREKEPEEPALEVGHPAGEILPADAKLLLWRKQGLNFPQIIPLYSKETGKTRMREWLRVRHHQVEHAIKGKAVSDGLLARVAEREPEAIEQINKIVNGSYPVLKEEEIEKQKAQLLVRQPGRAPHNRVPLNPKVPKDQPAVSEVRQRDCKIVVWRNEGSIWSDVHDRYFDEYEDEWSEDSFRKRYLVLQEAFQSARIGDGLVSQAATGDAAALKRINVLIHGEGFRGTAQDEVHDESGLSLPKQSMTVSQQPLAESPDESAAESSETSEEPAEESARPATVEYHVIADTQGETARPKTGGKTVNAAFVMEMLGQINSAPQELSEPEESFEEEDDPSVEEDRHYYLYRIFLRELDFEQLECYEDISPKAGWEEYARHDCGNLDEANAKAIKILWDHEWLEKTRRYYDDVQDPDDDGCMHSGATNPALGRVEVKVERILKGGNPTKVKGARSTVPKTNYIIKQKITEESVDKVFGESHTKEKESVVENSNWTDLSLANKHAAAYFVQLAFKSKSINLNERDAEQKEMLAGLYQDIEANPGEMFNKTAKDEKLSVWVEKLRLRGPRNI